jgi:Flp pilus assembly CpaF family ATPase
MHANSPGDALSRLHMLASSSDGNLPHHAIAAMAGNAVDLVVHLSREPCGHRRVVSIAQALPQDAGLQAKILLRWQPAKGRTQRGAYRIEGKPTARLAQKLSVYNNGRTKAGDGLS